MKDVKTQDLRIEGRILEYSRTIRCSLRTWL